MAGRKKNPWGKRIGLASATIDRLAGGENVGGDVLALVCRTENVSLSWLLEGKGRPYLVHPFDDDDEAAEYMAMLLGDEEGWEVYEVHAPNNRLAYVLTMPGAVERKGAWIHYTIVEVVVGALSDRTRAVVMHHIPNNQLHPITIDDETMSSLTSGRLGTWHLIGDDESPGILGGAAPADRIQDGAARYAPPSADARMVATWYDDLPREKQLAVRVLFGIGAPGDDDPGIS